MPSDLLIKNVPDDIIRGLRNRALANQRTLQQELRAILRLASRDQADVSIDTLLDQTKRKKPALDETASRVLAAKEAEQSRMARRFDDLLGRTGDPEPDR